MPLKQYLQTRTINSIEKIEYKRQGNLHKEVSRLTHYIKGSYNVPYPNYMDPHLNQIFHKKMLM